MKKAIILLCSLFLFNISYSQKKKEYYYSKDGNVVCETTNSIKNKIVVNQNCKSDSIITKGIITTVLTKIVVPLAVNNISKAVYKPKKYATNHSESIHLFQRNAIVNINDIDCFEYQRTINDSLALSQFFTISDAPKAIANNFKLLEFKNYTYNLTATKLKNKHHKVNLVTEIFVNYYKDGELKTLALRPFYFNKKVPTNNNYITIIEPKDNYRFIPTQYPIKSIQVKVSEVNTRKKAWDKWLAFFNKHKDDIKDYINGKLEDD